MNKVMQTEHTTEEAPAVSTFAEAFVTTINQASATIRLLQSQNVLYESEIAHLRLENARLLMFVRQVAQLTDPAAMSPVSRLFAIHDLAKEAARILKVTGDDRAESK